MSSYAPGTSTSNPSTNKFLVHYRIKPGVPANFPDLRERFVYWLSDFLNGVLPPPYYTGMASRVWIETSYRRIGPDVDVLQPPGEKP